jgi:hypothetical protein
MESTWWVSATLLIIQRKHTLSHLTILTLNQPGLRRKNTLLRRPTVNTALRLLASWGNKSRADWTQCSSQHRRNPCWLTSQHSLSISPVCVENTHCFVGPRSAHLSLFLSLEETKAVLTESEKALRHPVEAARSEWRSGKKWRTRSWSAFAWRAASSRTFGEVRERSSPGCRSEGPGFRCNLFTCQKEKSLSLCFRKKLYS